MIDGQEALNYELMDAAENGRLEDIASLIGYPCAHVLACGGLRSGYQSDRRRIAHQPVGLSQNMTLYPFCAIPSSGADINAVDVVGWTPLIYGAENAGSVALLLRLGADVHAKATRCANRRRAGRM